MYSIKLLNLSELNMCRTAKNIINMKRVSLILLFVCVMNINLIGINCAATNSSVLSTTISTSTPLPVAPTTSALAQPSCSAVNPILTQRGLNSNELLLERNRDVVVKYCEMPTTGTCCTYSMESRLAAHSRMQLDKNTKDVISKLATVLETRAKRFNEFFIDLLTESKKEFHLMFKRTYGIIYEQNSYVFSDLFNELEKYYSTGNVDLFEAMDSFFNTLYQKMFTVLNQQYKFDDNYLGCVSENMKELKPFGDVPHKLSLQIKRSFVATRTFAKALNVAVDVAKTMINVRPSPECTTAITKLQQCGVCGGYTEKPCANYCVNVMKGCLNHFMELDTEWDNFVSNMDKLADRLLGPFNIVMVVEPINIKISEAIMNFQETGPDITQQIFHGCGKPELGRRRRRSVSPPLFTSLINDDTNLDSSFSFDDDNSNNSIEETIINENEIKSINKRSAESAPNKNREIESFEPVQFNTDDFTANKGRRKNKNNKNGQQQNGNNDDEDDTSKNDNLDKDYDSDTKEPVLDKLIKDIRQKVRDSKKFWSNLPYQICNHKDLAALPTNEGQCWNGKTIDRYFPPIATDLKSNPEFTTPPTISSRHSSLIANKLYSLKVLINHLRNAYVGINVEWNDQEEGPEYGSGSGSGISNEDNDDIGSGIGSIDFDPRLNPIDHAPPVHPEQPGIVGDPTTTKIIETTEDNNNNKNVHTKKTKVNSSENEIISSANDMSIHRALFTYLFPIFVAWFGSCFSDLL